MCRSYGAIPAHRNRAAYRRVDGQGSTTGSTSATGRERGADLDRQHHGAGNASRVTGRERGADLDRAARRQPIPNLLDSLVAITIYGNATQIMRIEKVTYRPIVQHLTRG